tara:strand:- start:600 stop:860 length:261 start_codon:yes stop_codon:yes gene_type:complete
MDFYQKKDGSCHLKFTPQERKIILEKGYFVFTPEALRHFGNRMINMVAMWNRAFSKDIKSLNTIPTAETEIEAWKPKEIDENKPIE